jgi:hypothetical protein
MKTGRCRARPAALVGLCLVVTGCQSTASVITVENRTTGDVILVADHLYGRIPYLVPACGRIVFDPHVKPIDPNPESTHPRAAVIPYFIGLVPDAPTVATVVISSRQIWTAYGPAPSLAICEGDPPTVSPEPTPSST